MSATPITAARIAELKAKGYFVEDMGQEYGEGFEGEFRWMNENGDFQDGRTSDSEADAWVCADAYHCICVAQ